MQDLDIKVEKWKKLLLDLGKRNRLINFKETKRSNVAIVSPDFDVLYRKIVNEEEKLKFSFALKTSFDEDGEEVSINVEEGDLKTNKTLNEQQKSLKVLRGRAKTSIEEQGINTLYLTFGMICWKESNDSSDIISSPVILVPVSLSIESITDPYVLQLHEDEIVVNPSLSFKFENDFGIELPEFDGHEDDINDYLKKIKRIVRKNEWKIVNDVHLTLLSFLKINMYKDLDNNKDKIVSNPTIKALSGDKSEVPSIPNELNCFDHDKNTRPIDTYQVVDADSSQQDAIVLSKKGISFVLQGPPGTGKSQTITNIIAEALADGKKVLFVSEKMAALEVVKKRLTEAGLSDFCLTLHSYKANKKEILKQLSTTLATSRISLREDAIYNLSILEEKRKKLNEYHEQLHEKCHPLNISIYEANGRLAKLSNTTDVIFQINNVENTDIELLNKYRYLLSEFSNTLGKKSADYCENPWYNCNVPIVTHEIRHDIEVNLKELSLKLKTLVTIYEEIIEKTGANIELTINNISELYELLDFSSQTPTFPQTWLLNDMVALESCAQNYLQKFTDYKRNKTSLLNRYTTEIFEFSANEIISTLESNMTNINTYLNNTNFPSNRDVVLKADFILNECGSLKSFLQKLSDDSKEIAVVLGLAEGKTISSVYEVQPLINLIAKDPQPVQAWFDCGEIQNIIALLKDAEREQEFLSDNLECVRNKFDEDVLNVNYEGILTRFECLYPRVLEIISRYNGLSQDYNLNVGQISSFVNEDVKQIKDAQQLVNDALVASRGLADVLGHPSISSLSEMDHFCDLLSSIVKKTKPTLSWFDEAKEHAIDQIIIDIKQTHNEIETETKKLLNNYDKEIFSIDYKGMLARFNTEYTNFLKILKSSYRNDEKTIRAFCKDSQSKLTDSTIIAVLNQVLLIKEKEEWLIENKSLIDEMIGTLYLGNYTNWELVDECRANFKIIKNYFGVNRIPEKLKNILLEDDVEKISSQYSAIKKMRDNNICDVLASFFGVGVQEHSILQLLDDMRAVVDISDSVVADCKTFSAHIDSNTSECNLTVGEIRNVLASIKLVNQKRQWFKEREAILVQSFGRHYVGETTNWDNVRCSIDVVERILQWFGSRPISNTLKENLLSNMIPIDQFKKFAQMLEDINSNILVRLDNLLTTHKNQNISFDCLIDMIGAITEKVNISFGKYNIFAKCSKDVAQFETVMADIVLLHNVQETEILVQERSVELEEKYQFAFSGMDTDWNLVISRLHYAKQFKDLSEKFLLSKGYIDVVCDNDESFANWVINIEDSLKQQENSISNAFKWYAALFDEGETLFAINLYTVIDKIEKGVNNLFLLEEWIDFRGIRQQCKEIGLAEFVQKVEQMDMNPKMIVDIFFKRFYRLWLDAMIPNYPAIYTFRGRSHQTMINEFRRLDEYQLEIARLRIIEKLILRLPNTNIATSSVDEVGILKRELSKQRNVMPLRKLFKAIPNLLTALKPCLMMSPLSVSLFLQADGYNFDTVIFDEASQVCTEDAIGAIMRGKQVVIAGDSNQLPPTSFFATTLSDGEFDIDDDDILDDTGSYDSVLEEAVNAIPERTLKWHYRSRHEHLIAFSNAKIYNNELITFPSSIDKVADNGVEYIYVENGVYDRGGKKHNLNEAKCVAKLVFEHFKKYPNRSLGVVTFSEAQSQAIDSAIRQIRLGDSQYEQHFSEDNEQAFFVKNLENVQGDERDTIIFSIGYAKDQNGIMYMNFGPLSRNGGQRRLNVAITRAKYNVKLVGSIHPTDIRLESTNSEGVKMLRQYIEFAINGPSVLHNELQFNDAVNVDSPFEEAVYDFLVKNGYNVVTQVGCSGYRIDMAVKHPTISGVFVLGIECDGATYHSARTARERDRLRQIVLEDIGWKIYRIWSTDWVKDTKTEGNKLLEAVENAISNYALCNVNEVGEIDTKVEPKDSSLSIKNAFTVVKPLEDKNYDNPFNFDYYRETDICEAEKSYSTNDLSDVIGYVVQQECPIHYELLCKRVAPLFGNKKATVKVKKAVDDILERDLKNIVMRRGEFCWHKNINEINVRIPSPQGDVRTISYISKEELAKAMSTIVDNSFGITPNDLYVVTARTFGFNRTTGNIIQSMEQACSYLLKTGKAREVDGKIVL